jgi:hypothetical protein
MFGLSELIIKSGGRYSTSSVGPEVTDNTLELEAAMEAPGRYSPSLKPFPAVSTRMPQTRGKLTDPSDPARLVRTPLVSPVTAEKVIVTAAWEAIEVASSEVARNANLDNFILFKLVDRKWPVASWAVPSVGARENSLPNSLSTAETLSCQFFPAAGFSRGVLPEAQVNSVIFWRLESSTRLRPPEEGGAGWAGRTHGARRPVNSLAQDAPATTPCKRPGARRASRWPAARTSTLETSL